MITKTIILKPTNDIEISLLINTLKNKNVSVDNIHTNVLKKICNYIAMPLSYIINLRISKATCPDHFKIAEVIPIYKSNDKQNLNNYRPISLKLMLTMKYLLKN